MSLRRRLCSSTVNFDDGLKLLLPSRSRLYPWFLLCASPSRNSPLLLVPDRRATQQRGPTTCARRWRARVPAPVDKRGKMARRTRGSPRSYFWGRFWQTRAGEADRREAGAPSRALMAAGEWLADSGRFGQGGVRVNAGEGRRGGVEALGVRNRKGTRPIH